MFFCLQDSSGRDLKSAQNTPSRQPLAQPNTNQTSNMAPPPLTQDNRNSILAGQDFSKKVQTLIFEQAVHLAVGVSLAVVMTPMHGENLLKKQTNTKIFY